MNAVQDDGAPAPARTETGTSPNATGSERNADTGKDTPFERTFDSPLAGALACAERGWPVLPVMSPEADHKDRGKASRPGFAWTRNSSTDPAVIAGWDLDGRNENFGVYAARADLVILDEDQPGAIDEWAAHLGITFPATFTVASGRAEGGRHMYFRADGTTFSQRDAWPGVNVRHRGYVVGPGSVHPETGALYTVTDGRDPVPLPAEAAEALLAEPKPVDEPLPAQAPVDDETAAEYAVRTVPVILRKLRATAAMGEHERNDKDQGWEGKSGPINDAASLIELSNAAPGAYPLDRAEADFMSTAPRGEVKRWQRKWDWALRKIGDRPRAVPPGAQNDFTDLDGATPELAAFDPLTDVFDATDTLGTIRQAAYARVLSAPALLGYVLVRILAQVPHTVRLPPVVGSAASLNLGVAIVGDSGGGKSSTLDTSRDLLGLVGDLQGGVLGIERSLGSGEGLAATYLRPAGTGSKNRRLELIPAADRRRIMVVDEVEALGASKHRQGATIGPMLRTALTGGALGQENASLETRRYVPGGEYRLVMVAGVQPTKSGVLLDEADLGTPQRFIWLPARDPLIPDEDEPWPGDLGWVPGNYSRVEWIDYSDDIKAKVRADRRAAQRGTATDRGLTGHLNLTRLKVAAALALLHDETFIGDRWWGLAGRIVEASLRQQDYCRGVISSAEVNSARARGRMDQVRADGAAEVRDERVTGAAVAVFKEVRRHAEDVPHVDKRKHLFDAGCTDSCLRHGARNYRKHGAEVIDPALAMVKAEGWIESRDGRWFLGPSQPADG